MRKRHLPLLLEVVLQALKVMELLSVPEKVLQLLSKDRMTHGLSLEVQVSLNLRKTVLPSVVETEPLHLLSSQVESQWFPPQDPVQPVLPVTLAHQASASELLQLSEKAESEPSIEIPRNLYYLSV